MQIGRAQAKRLKVKPRVQQSPMMELCALRMGGTTSFVKGAEDVTVLTGVVLSASTLERILERNPQAAATVEAPVQELALDGGMVRLVTPKGEPSEWKQYKAIRVNGDGVGMAWFGEKNDDLLSWTETLTCLALVFCLGDGHAGIWSLFAKMTKLPERRDILDWYHLKENLHKVSGSNNRLKEAETFLWKGEVDSAIQLFVDCQSDSARKFRAYLDNHRSRIVNYGYYQLEGLPIGSGPVESWIKQIDSRIQITGASWKSENIPRILALRSSYLNSQLGLHSLSSG
jgi:hypothetical protein